MYTSVGVVGNGTMGKQLADWLRKSGVAVVHCARRDLEQEAPRFAECKLVFECVAEDFDTKSDVLRLLDATCLDDCVIATTTSSLSLDTLKSSTPRHLAHFLCIHLFNPIAKSRLVEVVSLLTTSPAVGQGVAHFMAALEKKPVQLTDTARYPGFIVNSLLFPYLNSAAHMLDAGYASKEDIDYAMQNACRHPLGPFALMDFVGLDVTAAIIAQVDTQPVAECITAHVAAGNLGKKVGRGFYTCS